jgi:hypothetical protein
MNPSLAPCPYNNKKCVRHHQRGDIIPFNTHHYFQIPFSIENGDLLSTYYGYGKNVTFCNNEKAKFVIRINRNLCCHTLKVQKRLCYKGLPFPIIGHAFKLWNDNYLVYENGALFSLYCWKFMIPQNIYKTEYCGYRVIVGKKKLFFSIHRLVYIVFKLNGEITLLPSTSDINHIDSNVKNNHLSNLQVTSRVQNLKHATLTRCWFYEFRKRPMKTFENDRALKRIWRHVSEEGMKKMVCLNCRGSTLEDKTLTICKVCLHILRVFPRHKLSKK